MLSLIKLISLLTFTLSVSGLVTGRDARFPTKGALLLYASSNTQIGLTKESFTANLDTNELPSFSSDNRSIEKKERNIIYPISLLFKLFVVLGLKSVKDVIFYSPKLLWRSVQNIFWKTCRFIRNGPTGKADTNKD
jgi:hypothetical protein